MNHPEHDKREPIDHIEDLIDLNDPASGAKKDLDELVLDRLVDNDLSPEEYKAVLNLVEEKPDGWRMLALAFLESQAFENDLSEMRLDESHLSSGHPAATETSVANEAPISDHANHSVAKDQSHPIKQSTEGRAGFIDAADAQDQTKKGLVKRSVENGSNFHGNDSSAFWRGTKQVIPAIVACLVIAFIATIYVREMQNQRGRFDNVVSIPPELNNDLNSDNGRNQNYIQLVGNNDGESMRAPVYDHDTFDQKEAAESFAKFTPRLREVLTSSGLTANERTHVMPIKDRAGNKIILPIKEFKLTPTKWEGYQ